MDITRERVLEALKARLEPLDFIYSLYEGGAAAWHRADEWSDIDLGLALAEGRLEDAFAAVTAALEGLAPVDLVYDVPNPPATAQKLYHVRGSSPFLVIDLCFDFQDPAKPVDEAIERDVHGDIICHFDKVSSPRYGRSDQEALAGRLRKRLAAMPAQFRLFQTMPLKELNRGNWVEAIVFYNNATLRLLVELLGIKYRPWQAGFHTRYIYYDFPAGVVRRLEHLYFVPRPEGLRERCDEAEAWFFELHASIDPALLPAAQG
jgi:hypothetical protein